MANWAPERGEFGTPNHRGCRVGRTTDQTGIPSSTLTKITFSVIRYGDSDMWSASAPTRIVIPVSGYWEIGGACEWSSSVTGERYADVFKNNTTIISEMAGGMASTAGGNPVNQGTSPALLAAGDFLEMRVYQNAGISRDILTEVWGPDMWAFLIGN